MSALVRDDVTRLRDDALATHDPARRAHLLAECAIRLVDARRRGLISEDDVRALRAEIEATR